MLTPARHGLWLASALLGALATSPVAGAKVLPDFEIREWFALGSGCRALPGSEGDVQLQASARGGLRYELSFALPSYGLDSRKPFVPGASTFARECGVRIALYPGRGRRLKSVSASSGFVYSKDRDAKLRLRARLQLGSTILAQKESWVEGDSRASAEAPNTFAFDLAAANDEAMKKVRCEQPKIVGVDLSIATFRDDVRPEVAVSMLHRALSLRLEFEPCTRSKP